MLISLPQVGGLLGRNLLDVVPLLLQFFEIVVGTIDFIRVLCDGLYLFNDFNFLLIVLLAFLLLRSGSGSTLFAENSHEFLEFTLFEIRRRNIFLGIASFFDEFLVGGITLLVVDAVEITLEAVEFLASYLLVTFCQGFQSCNNFSFGLISGDRSGRGFCLRFFDSFFGCRSFCCFFS